MSFFLVLLICFLVYLMFVVIGSAASIVSTVPVLVFILFPSLGF